MKSLVILFSMALVACGGGGSSGGGVAPVVAAAPAPAEAQKAPQNIPENIPGPTRCHVLIYGDSIIADPLLSETMPASIKRQRPEWTVENRAHGGETAFDGGRAAINDYIPPGARVVLEWGVNDSKLGTRIDAMGDAARYVKSQGAVPIITGLVRIGDVFNATYNDEARRIAIETGAAFVSWNELEITTFDGTHPDQASTDRLVDDLLHTLDAECAK